MAPTFNNFKNKDGKKDNYSKNNYNDNDNKRKYNKNDEGHGNDEGYLDNKEKRLRKAERKSSRKNSNIIEESKIVWIKLIQTSNTKKQISELMKELMNIVTNNIEKLVIQHDSSRIIQSALKFGNQEQRKIVLYELKDVLLDMSNTQYGRFVVCKLIKELCDKNVKDSATCRKVIIKAFKGHVYKIAYHKYGSQVLNDIYKTFPTKDYTPLKQEFYSRQYTFLTQNLEQVQQETTLATILKKYPEKRKNIIQSQYDILQKVMDKELLDKLYFHDLLHDYISCCTTEELNDNEIVSTLCNTHSMPLLSSKIGALVFCKLCKIGTSKDRKQIIKDLLQNENSVKDYMLHKDSFIGILTLLQVTDDTKATGKIIKSLFVDEQISAPTRKEEQKTTEISPLLDFALNDIGCKLFLLLLPDDYKTSTTSILSPKKYFEEYEQEILFNTPSKNSKKDSEIRRKELCAFVQEELCALCMNHTYELITSKVGSNVLREVYNTFPTVELMDVILNICGARKDEDDENDTNNAYYMFEDPKAHLFIKNLFLSECDIKKKKDTRAYYYSKAAQSMSVSFAAKFYEYFQGQLGNIALASNRGAFVISALCDVEAVKEQVKKELQSIKKHLEDIVGEKEKGGHACLLNCLNEE